MSSPQISIMILTLNEEINIEACLDSLKDFDDIVVFDSFSTDKTTELADDKSARVVQRKFDNWAAHQNWAMENIDFKHPWVFYLDADERMTPELQQEISHIASDPEEKRVAFYCGRKNYFMGQWIRHCYPPSLIMRFFKPPYIRFERLVNPVPVLDGEHGYLNEMFLHYNFSKGLTEWFDKHNRYSLFEAMEGRKSMKEDTGLLDALKIKDRAAKRAALKRFSFKLPLRGMMKFLYLYIFSGGFLDGYAGFTYCRLQAIYENMIEIKMKELARKEQNLPI